MVAPATGPPAQARETVPSAPTPPIKPPAFSPPRTSANAQTSTAVPFSISPGQAADIAAARDRADKPTPAHIRQAVQRANQAAGAEVARRIRRTHSPARPTVDDSTSIQRCRQRARVDSGAHFHIRQTEIRNGRRKPHQTALFRRQYTKSRITRPRPSKLPLKMPLMGLKPITPSLFPSSL